jgi:hypothetical protein
MATLQKPLEHTVVQEPLVHELLDAEHSAWKAGLSLACQKSGDILCPAQHPHNLQRRGCWVVNNEKGVDRKEAHGLVGQIFPPVAHTGMLRKPPARGQECLAHLPGGVATVSGDIVQNVIFHRI